MVTPCWCGAILKIAEKEIQEFSEVSFPGCQRRERFNFVSALDTRSGHVPTLVRDGNDMAGKVLAVLTQVSGVLGEQPGNFIWFHVQPNVQCAHEEPFHLHPCNRALGEPPPKLALLHLVTRALIHSEGDFSHSRHHSPLNFLNICSQVPAVHCQGQ